MQIERLVKDLAYAEKQAMKGGVFFQGWTEGVLSSKDFAPAIASDAVYIYGMRNPLSQGIVKVLQEIERRTPEADILPIVFTLGWMVGKGHERAKRAGCTGK